MSDGEILPQSSEPPPSVDSIGTRTDLSPTTISNPNSRSGLGIGRSIILMFAFYAVFVVGCFFAGVVAGILMATSDGSVDLLQNLFALITLPQIAAWIVTIMLGLRWLGAPPRVACSIQRFSPRLIPALLTASFGAAILLAELVSWIPMPEAWREAAAAQRASSHLIWLVIPVVVVAPLAEEVFFRGIVLRGYLERYSIGKTIWVSAAMFAIFHLNPWQIVFAFPLGLWFAWIAIRTSSVFPSMISHAVVNLTVSFLLWPLAIILGYTATEMREWRHYPASVLAIGTLCLVIGGYNHWRQLKGIVRPADGDSPQVGLGTADVETVRSLLEVSDG